MRKLFLFLVSIILSCTVWAVDYSQIDKFALTAPPVTSKSTLRKAVAYMTKPYKTDEEKARVLLAWIVYNIDYDYFLYENQTQAEKRHVDRSVKDSDILKTHMGVCRNIARLYVDMLQFADIKAGYVGGYAGEGLTEKTYEDYKHAWVYVKIGKKDLFVDPTWAITGGKERSTPQKRSQYRAELKARKKSKGGEADSSKKVDSKWFLVTPEEMIKTHFPDNSQDQFVSPKISLNNFLKGQSK